MIKNEERQRYRELLAELRTVIPGAQVLFAFLLTVPFATRFSNVDYFGKIVFTISLMAVTVATILFLAPAAYHRLAGRHDRQGRLRFGVRTTLAGMLFLALSIVCAVFVVVRFLFDNIFVSVAMTFATVFLAVIMWYFLPVYKRKRSQEPSESQSES